MTDRNHSAEAARLTEYLDRRVREDGGVPASRARPEKPYIALIARETSVPKGSISNHDGRHRKILQTFVSKYPLVPYAHANGRAFEESDRLHARLIEWLHARVAGGHGIPGLAGRPNFKMIARLVPMGRTSLTTEGHRNRLAVQEAFEAAGAGPERLRGPIP
ncbi:hypothetical protein SAMN05444171_4799 [Bradyrhizobium lablabi]|uniref:Uncharacterized protein n=2 Tax=Bradyrhizobium TaxID=374 RepID=A0ABY0PFJ6_9BRAD|nr:hypothetical protein SAMN05444163_2367 [Bradyrhizobium ottawaense]SED68259.1 hypothetical protein SAMN05444171_4799 [Bradyrhizobium lablabi]